MVPGREQLVVVGRCWGFAAIVGQQTGIVSALSDTFQAVRVRNNHLCFSFRLTDTGGRNCEAINLSVFPLPAIQFTRVFGAIPAAASIFPISSRLLAIVV